MRKHNLIISVALLCVAIFLVVSCDETKTKAGTITSLDLPEWAVGKTYTGTGTESANGQVVTTVNLTMTTSKGEIKVTTPSSDTYLQLSDADLLAYNCTGSVTQGSNRYSITVNVAVDGASASFMITLTPKKATFNYTGITEKGTVTRSFQST